MNRQRLQAMAGACARRRISSLNVVGMSGLGSVASDLQRRQTLLNAVQAFQSELLHSVDGMAKSAIKDNAEKYASVMNFILNKLSGPESTQALSAGGDTANRMRSLIAGAEQTLAETKRMWDADLNDPSGAASMMVAQQIDQQAKTQQLVAGEKLDFWVRATDINNPFSPVGILSTIKKYAIWGLVIGGVVLAAPTLFPAIGKLIGGARRPQPAPPPPQPVVANRRRR